MVRLAKWMLVGSLVVSLAACSTSTDGERRPATSTSTSSTDAARGRDEPSVPGGPDAPPRPSSGCDAPPLGPTVRERMDLPVGSAQRYYLVTAPASSGDEPLPLVLDLHGLIEGAEVHAEHTRLGEFGQDHGFVTVFPNGRGEPVAWDASTGEEGNADLRYIDALIDRVTARRCIDEARIYAVGLSNGAMMVSALACERSDRFAAVSMVAGILAPEPCDQARRVPILATHGTADPILPFDGGAGDLGRLEPGGGPPSTSAATGTSSAADLDGPGYPANVAEWARRYDCTDPIDDEPAPTVLHRTYECPPSTAVEMYVVEGGGHTWPGSRFSSDIEHLTGPTTFEIDWNELVWEFFQRFTTP